MNPTLLDFDPAFFDADLDRVFVVSDPHFGHANIIQYCHRPFADADEMDVQLIARWNRTVPADAAVWVLGDVTTKPDNLAARLNQLKGRKVLVAGNHDQPHPVSLHNKGRRPEELAKYARAYRAAGFDAVHLVGAFELPDFGRVFVTHYPYSDLRDWLRVRLPDDGITPLLHGHVHDKWRFRGRMLNVGVEVQDYRPISLREVRDLFRTERAAGWPTATTEPDDEKIPDAPAAFELAPEERFHVRRWFTVTDGGALPELPGASQRLGENLLEVWIDGTNSDGEMLWRRCFLSPALVPVASQFLSPRPGGVGSRQSASERVAALGDETPAVRAHLAAAAPAPRDAPTSDRKAGRVQAHLAANGPALLVLPDPAGG